VAPGYASLTSPALLGEPIQTKVETDKAVVAQDCTVYTHMGCAARGGNIMKPISCLFVMAALASPGSTISNAHAETSFDGAWRVQIMIDRGNCDPVDRLTVDIRDGAMQYSGDSSVSIQGQVVNGGAVRVRFAHGEYRVNGSGRLSGTSGAGTWHGTGMASACAGRWSAERAPTVRSINSLAP
jgi:hypothetical protein